MFNTRPGAAALVLCASLVSPVWAGQHFICFHLPNEIINGVSRPMGFVACADDSGAACTVGTPTGAIGAGSR